MNAISWHSAEFVLYVCVPGDPAHGYSYKTPLDNYSTALFWLRVLSRIMGTEARFDSATGNKAAPCIMGTLLMCIKLRADGATGQPGNTLNSYADNTLHSGHSIILCSHRSLELNLIETVEIWPEYCCVWQSWVWNCSAFSGCLFGTICGKWQPEGKPSQ